MWSALAKDLSKFADTVRGESRGFVDMLNEITSDIVSTKSTYAGDEDFFSAIFPSSSHERPCRDHDDVRGGHAPRTRTGVTPALDIKELHRLQESDDTYTQAISAEEQPDFDAWAATNVMSSRRIRTQADTPEQPRSDGGGVMDNKSDASAKTVKHTEPTMGEKDSSTKDESIEIGDIAQQRLYKARLRLLNYNSTVQAKYDRFAGEDPHIGQRAPTPDEHPALSSPSTLHPNEMHEHEAAHGHRADTHLSPDKFFDRYFFRLYQLRRRAAEQAALAAGNAARDEAAAQKGIASATRSGEPVVDYDDASAEATDASSVHYRCGGSSDSDGDAAAAAAAAHTPPHRSAAKSRTDTLDQTSCAPPSRDDSSEDKPDEPIIQSFAAHVLRRAGEFMSTIEDAVDLIDKSSSDSDDFNVSLSRLILNSNDDGTPAHETRLNTDRNTDANAADRVYADSRQRGVDERGGGACELPMPPSQHVHALELVVQELQNALRVERERVARLTELLQEHDIAIPEQWMRGHVTQETPSRERSARAGGAADRLPDRTHCLGVAHEMRQPGGTEAERQRADTSAERRRQTPESPQHDGDATTARMPASKDVSLPRKSSSQTRHVDANEQTQIQEVHTDSSNSLSGWDVM